MFGPSICAANFALCLLMACYSRDDGHSDVVPMQSISVISQLETGWLVRRVSGAAGDGAFITDCQETGFYVVQAAEVASLLTGNDGCLLAQAADHFSFRDSVLLYNDRTERGALRRFSFRTSSFQDLQPGCGQSSGAPSWSPGGEQVAFSSGCEENEEAGLLAILNLRSGRMRVLASPDTLFESHPSWSPDGMRIAVQRGFVTSGSTISVVEPSSGRRRLIAHGYSPAWSPAGDWIAFARTSNESSLASSVWIVKPDGSGIRQLAALVPGDSRDPALITGLVWNLRGNGLAYSIGSELLHVTLGGVVTTVRRF